MSGEVEVITGEVISKFVPDALHAERPYTPDNRKGIKYCGAKTRKGGECKGLAMENGRCRMHGGTAPRGFAASNFKTGRYSAHLPKALLDMYESSRSDPDILALNDEIGLVDARLMDLITKLDKQESSRLWVKASEIYGYLVSSLRSGDISSVNRYMSTLGEVLTKGHDEYGVWRDIGEQLDRRRSLVEAERRRLIDAQYMIDVDKARTLMAALAASVRKHVQDPKSLQAISEDFLRLTSGGREQV